MEIPKQELWEARLSDWEASGMDIRSWCRQKNLDEKQFHYWKRQLRAAPAVQEPVFAEYHAGTTVQGAGTRNQPVLYIQGMKLCIPDSFNQDTLLSLTNNFVRQNYSNCKASSFA